MGRRSEHSKDEIKTMALKAAEKIIVEEGGAALSARKIATAIGYTVGSLYMVFRNLDDLMLQMNAKTIDDLERYLKRIMDESDSPEKNLKALGQGYVNFALEHRSRWSVLFEHRLPDDMELPGWYQEKLNQMFNMVESQLKMLKPEKDQESLYVASSALWGGVHGICILGITKKLDAGRINSVPLLVDSLISNFLRGF